VSEPKKDERFTFLEEKKPTKEPVTLKRPPMSLLKSGKSVPAVAKPVAGKSYNPLLEDWADLIEKEGAKEVEAEKKRLQEAREEAERIERALAAAAEPEPESDGNESVWESEWEGFSEPEDNSLKKKRPERKTPAQRNRIKRRKEAERKAKHEAKMKEKEKQAERIKELAKSVEEKEAARAAAALVTSVMNGDDSAEEAEEILRKKRFGKAP
jgi:nucleolar protein 53